MAKRGSITVFLALILGLLLSLLSSGLESVKMAAARTQILNGLDIGLYSLFGEYDKSVLRDFDLFAIDGTFGGKELNLGAVYEELESYMKPVLRQNSQKLSIEQGGISGYQLLTDANGEVFYQQAVAYMKETLGSHGVQLLFEQLNSLQDKTASAEEKGMALEEKGSIESYEQEMNSAQQKSQEALAKKNEQDGFVSTEIVPAETTTDVENPIPAIRRLRRKGILDLVLPENKTVSEKEVKKKQLVSQRKLESGFAMEDAITADSTVSSRILFQQYLMEKLGNYMKPGEGTLDYQIEYLLSGKDSDEANLKAIAKKLLLVREGINAACLAADQEKMAQVRALAAAIAAGFLIPPAAVVIEGALVLCWAFAESVLDVRQLFAGEKVPVMKNASNWQLSLQNLPALPDKTGGEQKQDEKGISYEDYLQIFLFAQSKEQTVMRGMDMVEGSLQVREKWANFYLDHCITALEASVDVQANKRKTYTIAKEYHYI